MSFKIKCDQFQALASLRSVFDVESLDEEAEYISVLINGLGCWLSSSMASLGLHHDHQRIHLQC